MMLSGVLMAATVLSSSLTGKAILFIASFVLIVVGLPLYSYILYRRETTKK
jgi:type IV secretory pathway VirB3-like protein